MHFIEFVTGNHDPGVTFANLLNLLLLVVFATQLVRYWRTRLRPDVMELEAQGPGLAEASSRDAILGRAELLRDEGNLKRKLELLRRIADRGGQVQPEGSAALTVAELDGALSMASHATGAAVLVGLFGTLIGLFHAVTRAQALVSSSDGDVAARVVALFSGLSMAFSAALVGVVCTILLGWMVTFVRRIQTSYLIALEGLVNGCLLPYFQPSPSTALIQSAAALTAMEGDLKSGLKRLVDDVVDSGEALTEEVRSQLNGVVTEMRERGTSLTSTIDRSFSQLASELSHILAEYQSANLALTRLLGVPEGAQRPLLESVQRLNSVTDGLVTATEKSRQLIPGLREALERQADLQTKNTSETLAAHMARLGSMVENQTIELKDLASRLTARTDAAIAKSLDDLRVPVTGMTDAQTALLDVLQKLRSTVAGIENELTEIKELRKQSKSTEGAGGAPTDHGEGRRAQNGDDGTGKDSSATDRTIAPTTPMGLFNRWFGKKH